MYPEETFQDYTHYDLKQMSNRKSMFILSKSKNEKTHQLTAIQYLLKINLLFMHALTNNN